MWGCKLDSSRVSVREMTWATPSGEGRHHLYSHVGVQRQWMSLSLDRPSFPAESADCRDLMRISRKEEFQVIE